MVFLNFLYAALIVALTICAFLTQQDQDARALLFYAGSLSICALFTLKDRRHGLVGAVVLSSLVLFSTGSRIWSLMQTNDTPNPMAFFLNIAALALSACFLFCAFLYWQKRKRLAPPPEPPQG